eukprot:11501914-Alexandrium_andersonii.AAC.1
MSASLVGSEMCIRDRQLFEPRLGPAKSPWPGPGMSPRLGLRAVGRPGAVSYTHLTLPTICSV